VLDGQDEDGVAEVVKAHAVVADTQPHLGRFDVWRRFTSPSPEAR
jgi:hypothetical protein